MTSPTSPPTLPTGRRAARLTALAAAVLWLALAAVAWIVAASFWPARVRLRSETVEVVAMAAVLLLALLLVSVVALVNTARGAERA